MQTALLAPLMALVLWTFVMCAWLYATRIPAIRRGRIALNSDAMKDEFNALIPPEVRWKADNYNHLLEQPTLFYAVVLALAVLGADDTANLALAWAYVSLRVIHSLVQATANIIMLRFSVFMLSTLVLLALSIRAAQAVFGT